MSKRTPEETLAAIESQADDDDMNEVLAMTPEERDRELAAAGFDLAAVDAKADALYAAAQAPTSGVTPLRRRRTLGVVMLLAAALAIAAAAAIFTRRDPNVAQGHPDTPSPSDSAEPTPAQRNAAELRKQAAAACDAKKVDECVDRINAARDLDPAGDTSPEAKAIRQRIEALKKERGGPERGDKPGRP